MHGGIKDYRLKYYDLCTLDKLEKMLYSNKGIAESLNVRGGMKKGYLNISVKSKSCR